MSTTVTQTLDLKGLSCPLPIAKTAQASRGLASGSVVEVLATDPGSVPDSRRGARAPATSCSSDRRRTASSAS